MVSKEALDCTPATHESTNNHSHSTQSPSHQLNTTTAMRPPSSLKFGPFPIPNQIFHISPTRLTYGLVNLKPLLPGHTLICPVRVVPRLSDLTVPETTDLFLTVRRVTRTLERVYTADAFNVAVQDGVEAGQSVPHVHVHVIPRRKRDLEGREGGDVLYEMMEGEEGDLGREMVEMLRRRKGREGGREFKGDGERRERSEEVMRAEAEWLKGEMERDQGVE